MTLTVNCTVVPLRDKLVDPAPFQVLGVVKPNKLVSRACLPFPKPLYPLGNFGSRSQLLGQRQKSTSERLVSIYVPRWLYEGAG